MEKRKTLRSGEWGGLYGKMLSFTSDVLTCSDFIQLARPLIPNISSRGSHLLTTAAPNSPPDEEEKYLSRYSYLQPLKKHVK